LSKALSLPQRAGRLVQADERLNPKAIDLFPERAAWILSPMLVSECNRTFGIGAHGLPSVVDQRQLGERIAFG
jgi:hypothetical protein